jgi:glycosyltransferase involved in cell wall biosynthesis
VHGPRVLFVQGAGVRAGAERALLGRLRHLPEHGIDATVAFLADGPFRAEVERTGVRTVKLADAPKVRDVTRLPAAVRELAALAREERAAVVEGCGEKMSLLAGWAARIARRGCVQNLQDAPRRSLEATAVQLIAAAGRHDAVVVPSEWMRAAFRRRLGLSARVIPNALVLEELPAAAADVRSLASWPPGTLVVGHFSRLVGWKGVDVLLDAVARLARDDVRVLLAGGVLYGTEPGHERQLMDRARRLGLGDRVHFAGHREDALELMAGCDVVCHCSVEPEPFGMSLLEALALGRAVVASRSGASAELVRDGSTGLLVAPGDAAGLAAALAALAGDPARRRALGERSSDDVRERYSSATVAEPLAALYREVAAKIAPR